MINWDLFRGSSHCRDTMYDFIESDICLTNLPNKFLPYMPEQAKEARKIKKLGVKKARRLVRAALKRKWW